MRFWISLALLPLGAVIAAAAPPDDAPLRDYSQWKLAGPDGQVADAVSVETRPGFEIEIVRHAGPEEGSWISLAWDDRGRVLVGREDKGILRFTFDESRKSVEKTESVNDTLLEPRGLLLAHNSLYVTANNSKGIYRLRDLDGNDTFEDVQLLRPLEGGVGHGRNGMALGPDGMIYVALGNNVRVPAETDPDSPYRNYALDRLLPTVWNEFLFDSDVVPPAGYIARMDPEGKTWQLVAGGFRNAYDLAFNDRGDLFTYDADMEWDAGAPWYRPTCVMHVVPGGEYGWRQGTSVWPDHFADALPRVVDIGLGSPTGVAFAKGEIFPPPYRDALFIVDWAYGRIISIHLSPRGASYSGRAETFVKGKPLNVTDLAFGPDGAMYFTVGGRRTRSALYRVKYVGTTISPVTKPDQFAAVLAPRSLDDLDSTFAQLTSDDPFIVHAARNELERMPTESWQEQALSERDSKRALPALLALARCGETSIQAKLLARLCEFLSREIPERQRLIALRACQLTLIRHGIPSDEQQRRLAEVALHNYPANSYAENYLRCELLVKLQAPETAGRTLALLDRMWSADASSREATATPVAGAASVESKALFFIFTLRELRTGWSIDTRRQYLNWLKRAEQFRGAHYMPRFLTYIRSDALATFSNEERRALADEIAILGRLTVEDQLASPPRALVREWSVDEALAAVESHAGKTDLDRGRKLLAEAQCTRCHRRGTQGIPQGPDLTHAAARFSRRDLLDAIINPSRVIDDKYRTLLFKTTDDAVVTGTLVGGDSSSLFIAADIQRPTEFRRIPKSEIAERQHSPLSPMPQGLLNTLTAEEVADLIAYIESDADE